MDGGALSVANPLLPSKLSEYLGSARNILSITTPWIKLDKKGVLPTIRHGDVRGLRDALVRQLRRELLSRPEGLSPKRVIP